MKLAEYTKDDQEIHICDECWDVIHPEHEALCYVVDNVVGPYYYHASCVGDREALDRMMGITRSFEDMFR